MNRRNAALHLARRYPDWDSLASKMDKRPDTLRKELTGADGYKWGVDDEELLIALCIAAKVVDPLAPITAGATNAHALVIPLPQELHEGTPTMKCLADAATDFGVFMSAVAVSVADNDVSTNELKDVERKFGGLVAKGQACVTNMIAMHEAGKPAHMRGGGK